MDMANSEAAFYGVISVANPMIFGRNLFQPGDWLNFIPNQNICRSEYSQMEVAAKNATAEYPGYLQASIRKPSSELQKSVSDSNRQRSAPSLVESCAIAAFTCTKQKH